MSATNRHHGCEFLIWSFEHDAWWRPEELGYTKKIDEAGTYSWERALEICAYANGGVLRQAAPQEAIVPIPRRRG
jgi:hypothetical protein